MLNLGVLLFIYGIAGSILINLVMFVRFAGRAQDSGPIFGEILGMLLTGGIVRSYTELLVKNGIEPTIFDELLHRINAFLVVALLTGLMLVALGLMMHG